MSKKESKAKTPEKLDHWLVEFGWTCPECGHKIMHSYGALADVGNPICMECDVDMELDS